MAKKVKVKAISNISKRHPVKRFFVYLLSKLKGLSWLCTKILNVMNFANYWPNGDIFTLVLVSYYEKPIWPSRGWARATLVFESISPIFFQWMSGRCSPFARWRQSTSSTSTPRLSTPPAPSKPPSSLTICTRRSLYPAIQVWQGAVQAWGSLVVRSLSSSPGKMLCLSRCR